MSKEVVVIPRSLAESAFSSKKRLSKLEAYIYLALNVNGDRTSFSKLASAWLWPNSKEVSRFLNQLKQDGLIDYEITTTGTLITVCATPNATPDATLKRRKTKAKQAVYATPDATPNATPEQTDLFDICWKAYNRKGSKKKSLEQWEKLTDEEQAKVLPHVKAYVGSRDLQFQRDFERYLRDKTFEEVIIKGNDTIYDPDKIDKKTEYHPLTDSIFQYWNDERKCLMFNGYIDQLNDGYTDDNRPDGAKVAWSMYEWIWSSQTKQWIKQND